MELDLRNVIWGEETGYSALAKLVDFFGMPAILQALSDIQFEQYKQITRLSKENNRIVVIDGKEYVVEW